MSARLIFTFHIYMLEDSLLDWACRSGCKLANQSSSKHGHWHSNGLHKKQPGPPPESHSPPQ